MKLRLHIPTLFILAAIWAGMMTHDAMAVPVSTAAARVVNTSIGRDKTLLCSLRDGYGFLWVGTMTGLACFDANGEKVYSNPSGVLPNSEGISVNSLMEYNDNIWFGGTRGLYIFDRHTNTVKRFPFKTKYGVQISSLVEAIRQAPDGKIWILTHGQGLFIFDPTTSQLNQNSRDGSFYSDIAWSKEGTAYCITHDGWLIAFNQDGKALQRLRLPDFETDKNPISLAFSGGRVWIAANRTIYSYTPGTDSVRVAVADTHHGIANSLLSGENGQIWLGSDEGIFSYRSSPAIDAAVLTEETNDIRLVDTRVAQLKEDTDGGLIIVTRTGISFIPHDTLAIRRIETPDGHVYTTTVNTILPSADGKRAWLGTDHGVATYDIETGTVSADTLPLGADIIATSIAETDTALWIGSRHQGLFRFHPSTGKTKRYEYDENTPYALISNGINDLFISSDGELFVLTNWGLCRYNPKSDNFSVLTETENAVPFLAMEEDRKGRLWTYTATNRLYVRQPEGGRFEQFLSQELESTAVFLLFKDNQQRLWAVTSGNRVMRYDEDKNDFVYSGTPVSADYPITFLQDADNGALWVSTDEGVVRFNPDTRFTDLSFLTDADVYSVHGASGKLPDGSILFGSLHGLCELTPTDTDAVTSRRQAYPLSISFPYAEDNTEERRRLGLDKLLYTLDEIRLPYSHNTFTIHFASSTGAGMPGVRYQYRLEGADPAWLQATGSEITFPHLAPGRYRLMVRADSSVDDSEIHTLDIRILPPWYLSWIAISAYILILMLLIWAYAAYIRRKMKRQAAATIQEMKTRQERETYESKMRFFINLVHDIRTPLTLINLPLDRIADAVNSGKANGQEEKKFVRSMQKNLDYLLGIINQLLDFRKAEQETEIRLARRQTDVTAATEDIAGRFAEPLDAKGKELTVEVEEPHVTASIDREKFDRVVMNLIGNATKYARWKVAVKLTAGKEAFMLSISDDGKGIPTEERERIFETYYQLAGDDVGTSLGTGLGLAYARLIARAHHGDITVSDTPGGGATFTLTLPINAEPTDEEAREAREDEAGVSTKTISESPKGGPSTEASSETGEKPTILLVEDNDELRHTVADTLKEHYNILQAADGKEALAILSKSDHIDVIVSDFMMPGIDGAELCRRVKEDVATSYLPFLMLTAKTGREAKEEAFEAGADAFVEKPFSIRQIQSQISNIIKTRHLFHERMQSGRSESAAVAEEAPFINKVDAEFLEGLNARIQENIFDDEFSIDAMAEQMHMSRSTFYRRMKAITGLSPVDYLKNYRLEQGARLLKEGMRATEVAIAVGFTSSSYFAKCFKAKYSILPKDYK